MTRAYLLAGCAFAGGCILPISTGAPMPATTVGKGKVGVAFSGEAPVLDLLADADNTNASTNDPIAYGAAPAMANTLTFSYGVTDHTDIEAAGEGAFYYFLLPIPTGASIGLRQHIPLGEELDLGIAARLGHITATTSNEDGTNQNGASANYGALQGILQYGTGSFRPLVAMNVMPARVRRVENDVTVDRFNGYATSITVGAMFVGRNMQAGPYLTGTNFYSDHFSNAGWFLSGGVIFAFRPDRHRKPEPPVVLTPDPPPYPPYPPQGGYPPPQGGYPPPQGGYPPPQGGYPPPQGGYPPPQGGYPPPQGGYPPPQGGYPPPQGGTAPH